VERTLTVVRPSRRRISRRTTINAIAAAAVFGVTGVVAQAVPRASQAPVAREVVIPFTVGPANCADRDRRYAVTMRIYNVLAQPVGIPTLLEQPSDPLPPGVAGRPLSNLRLPCGRYAAYWNARHITTGRVLPPGVYLYDLVVDGQRITRKMTLDP
jgi:hypothetical protein